MSKHRWWRKDRYGYPIEYIVNSPVKNIIRVIDMNIKKLFGKDFKNKPPTNKLKDKA